MVNCQGWKLPDFMFATKCSLSDACTSIGNQMAKLYGTIDNVKKKLSSRMNRLDETLDECAALSESTREEISLTQQKADMISFKSVHVAVRVLLDYFSSQESRIKKIEEKQVATTEGVTMLCQFTKTLENSRTIEYIQARTKRFTVGSSRLSFELPSVTPSAKAHLTLDQLF
ncbi:uncharacterized protein LOC111242692 [Vigna radiata var. radiata]|uniref:Uncharacterized protein LOC111242692 n=1 Tax=Vigna radiata var. radiata TaxID=3916 RepID=A0A3Q0FGX9_VIGRR|nr:uncharacterized protein LOC111242692 [Vigna radiata var. radiata]